ncbi:prolyl oligopeptidase family serine peptidase [Sphingopyxis indica]|uniref:prolyl oligopeptidase family serine peptidase n=1 Tax=Sphingopyxis indica TaxID=436663 RepID=UPI0029393423|nr:prolyl oligopeptidase family serine peptidase [Sphingopyxis indica]WOF44542.1 prolyl oligopeptidase family serine peptidase [Sphingopyxis indica]
MLGPCLRSGALFLALAPSITSVAADEDGHRWTLIDQLTVPEVRALALSADGRSVLYVARIADPNSDRTTAQLRHINLRTGDTRDILNAGWIDQLARIPGTDDWSARVDMGEGVQLYRISGSGMATPLVVHPPTAVFGDAEGAVYPGYGHGPLATGVRAYSWSPDGRWLWYVVLDGAPFRSAIRYDDAVTIERGRRRAWGQATASIFLRRPDGQDILIAKRPRSDRLTFFGHSFVQWKADEVRFNVMETDGDGQPKRVTLGWSKTHERMRVVNDAVRPAYWRLPGPRGGVLSSKGFGETRDLVETQSNGKLHSYGRFPFAVGDARATGGFLSANGARAIAGYRTIAEPRFGLAVVEGRRIWTIGGKFSLTNCDFTAALDKGACIAQSQTSPPEVVRINVDNGQVNRVASVSSAHEQIAPLAVEPRTWVNRHGYKADGYIIWPRGYKNGHRYPAIVITHAGDADDRFANRENQWEYPAQLFAEHGYVVLLVNTPRSHQTTAIDAAYEAWVNETRDIPPRTIQDLIWLNEVASFEAAVEDLIETGAVDPARVGIAGYSRGSQSVNVTMTQSKMFRAASSGDGGYLEPAFYPDLPGSYDTVFGGPPTDAGALPNYQRLAPSLRADQVCGAMLLQMATPYTGAVDLYAALRRAHVPAQITLYPGATAASDETHIFHIPSNRIMAMQENVAWFDYWLLGKRNPKSPVASRYLNWDKMREAAPQRCGNSAWRLKD